MRVRHLYLHVPFCVRRCSYCDFAVTVQRDAPSAAWLDAIEAELRLVVRDEGIALPLELETVYLGGGTPSLLGPGTLLALRERLERYARLEAGRLEWTAEANPESFTPDRAEEWILAGVNRLSLGAQTFHEGALRWMGRLHGPEGPGKALDAARRAGLDNISLDLIFGLPERLGRDLGDDVRRMIELAPDHVSLYGLTAEKATPLGRWVAEGTERLAEEETYEREYLSAASALADAGYAHYEVSNFARPGRESRHNRAYWEGRAYLGLGPGAHSFLPPRRMWNLRDWADYASRLAAGGSVREAEETIDRSAAGLERVWLGLRTSAGFAPETEAQERLAETWRARGWAEAAAGAVRLTPRGWLLLDRLAVELEAAA